MKNQQFIIEPHFRLQEWVAEEKGYFARRGARLRVPGEDPLDRRQAARPAGPARPAPTRASRQGRDADVSCACHWTVNVAASNGHGKLWADAYSVAPAGIFVPADSPIRTPEDLAGVPISVGYQSGSHYATIQALEQYLPRDQINLSFGEGMLFKRLENLLEGKSPASTLFSGPYYFAEQLGFRKIIDTTFMIAAMINGDARSRGRQRKFYRALKRAQRDIDLRPELYTHYYRNEFPERYHAADGHPPLGPRRAHRVRALHQGGVRPVPRMDRRARDLRRRQGAARDRQLRRGGAQGDLILPLASGGLQKPLMIMKMSGSGEPALPAEDDAAFEFRRTLADDLLGSRA